MSDPVERQLTYGARVITYTLRYENRRTLHITIRPECTVLVRAPLGRPEAEITAIVLRRAPWIAQRLDDYSRRMPRLVTFAYVSGEGHRYLGRRYRLRVMAGAPESVAINARALIVVLRNKSDSARVAELMQRWYRARAREVLGERLAACYPRVARLGVRLPKLEVRRMRARWGSARRTGVIVLNVKLIQAPVRLIDYVVLRELCRLAVPSRGPAYDALLDRVLPDWRERRDALSRYEFS